MLIFQLVACKLVKQTTVNSRYSGHARTLFRVHISKSPIVGVISGQTSIAGNLNLVCNIVSVIAGCPQGES